MSTEHRPRLVHRSRVFRLASRVVVLLCLGLVLILAALHVETNIAVVSHTVGIALVAVLAVSEAALIVTVKHLFQKVAM